jgi:N-acetylglucosamine-6-phosphate deacetylase
LRVNSIKRAGRLAAGADVVVMDDAGNVALTMVAGELAFRDSKIVA